MNYISWENCYEQEIKNFNQFGDEGEIWFGAQTAKRVINWLKNKPLDKENTRFIDIGCGNGFSCCMLVGFLRDGILSYF